MGTIVVGTTPTIYITDFNVIKPLEIERVSLIISRYGNCELFVKYCQNPLTNHGECGIICM